MRNTDLDGVEAKEKYNNVLKKYKECYSKSKVSGSGAITWKSCVLLKDYFALDPSVTSTILADTALPALDSAGTSMISNSTSIIAIDYKDTALNNDSKREDQSPRVKRFKQGSTQHIIKEFLSDIKTNSESKKIYCDNMARYVDSEAKANDSNIMLEKNLRFRITN